MSDEYFVESRGEVDGLPFWVYRQVGPHRIDYCQAVSYDTAQAIIIALNLLHNLGEATLQTIRYEDASEIYFVVQGEQAQAAYAQALPILKRPGSRDTDTGEVGANGT